MTAVAEGSERPMQYWGRRPDGTDGDNLLAPEPGMPWFPPPPPRAVAEDATEEMAEDPGSDGPEVDVEGGGVPLTRLEADICSMAGQLAASTREWLSLIAEFNRRKGWAQWGIKSCAHWLAWACSVAPGAAREYVRVAGALAELPLLDQAFSQGRLSYSKVRAVTRVSGRVDEQILLEQALLHTAAQLERLVRSYRKADGAGLDQQRHRRARWFFDEDGMLVLTARLPADQGAIVVAALEQALNRILNEASPETDEEADPTDTAPSAADALVAVAQDALTAGPGDSSGDDRHLVVLHASAELLTGANVDDPTGPCHLENGPGVDRSTAVRIACDAALVALIDSAVPGEQLRLGRKTRKISPALRRALRIRDGGCRFPGCHRRTHLEAHHVVHWLRGGDTDLDNLVLLCRRHHMTIHDEGFTVASVPGATDSDSTGWVFSRPDGVQVPAVPELSASGDQQPPAVDPDEIRPGWRGERFSLADSVHVLCQASKPLPRLDEN